jgi:hypothetical protein
MWTGRGWVVGGAAARVEVRRKRRKSARVIMWDLRPMRGSISEGELNIEH